MGLLSRCFNFNPPRTRASGSGRPEKTRAAGTRTKPALELQFPSLAPEPVAEDLWAHLCGLGTDPAYTLQDWASRLSIALCRGAVVLTALPRRIR